MKHRIAAIVLSICLLATQVLPAKTPDAPAPTARPAAKVTLRYWVANYPRQTGWAIQVVREWNLKNPDIQVKLQKFPFGQLPENVLRQAIKDHSTPDITSHLFPTNVSEFVQMGALLPLDAYPELMDAIVKRSGNSSLPAFRNADGHLYQVPWKCNPILMQYNAGLLASQRLGVPRTYSQFLAVGKALMAARKTADFFVWAPIPTKNWWDRFYDYFTLYEAATGGAPFVTARGKAGFQNPGGVAVMDFLAQSYRLGLSPRQVVYKNQDAQSEAFARGKIAFMITGPWNVNVIRDLAGETVKFDFAPVPVPDGANPRAAVHTYGNFRNIGIFSTCQHPQEAARFVAFLLEKQNDVSLLASSDDLPYRQGFQADPAFARVFVANPLLRKFADAMPFAHSTDNSPNFNAVLASLAEEFMACAVLGQKPAADAVRDAAKRVDTP